MRYPIHLNYEQTAIPIGFVELNDDVDASAINNGAIVPLLRKKDGEDKYQTTSFGLVPRQMVDITKSYV